MDYIICNATHGWFTVVLRFECCDAAFMSGARDLELPATIIREQEKTVSIGEVLGTRYEHAPLAGARWH